NGLMTGPVFRTLVITLLKSWGHNVTALDLGASGVNQKKALELKSISEYFEPLSEFMASSVDKGERVVLVGHSDKPH
ncbi:hypothetical protein HN51_058869, partial [Arachis hypogaea]